MVTRPTRPVIGAGATLCTTPRDVGDSLAMLLPPDGFVQALAACSGVTADGGTLTAPAVAAFGALPLALKAGVRHPCPVAPATDEEQELGLRLPPLDAGSSLRRLVSWRRLTTYRR